jgi:N6-adenosine-specific RNA methylase IME4
MTIEEIKALPVPELAYKDGCHIYLWTTHKYLPKAFEVLDALGADYECLLTWIKNVGITPFSWMYSTEHCLFARIGNLPLLKLGKRLDFEAKVREHSRKPDEFYNLIKEVSPEPRVDMFSREKRGALPNMGMSWIGLGLSKSLLLIRGRYGNVLRWSTIPQQKRRIRGSSVSGRLNESSL